MRPLVVLRVATAATAGRALPWAVAIAILACLACAFDVGCNVRRRKASPVPSATKKVPALARDGGEMGEGPEPALSGALPVGPNDVLMPTDRASVNQVSEDVQRVDSLVRRGLLTDLAQPGERDAVARCAAIERTLPRIRGLPDADGTLRRLVGEAARLCSLEVPILGCERALRQAGLSPSQASRRLMCGFARKDLERARAARPGASASASERRVTEIGERFRQICRDSRL